VSRLTSGPANLPAALGEATGLRFNDEPSAGVAGGCINECLRWETSGGAVFVKLGPVARLAMFDAESEGLRELEAAHAIRVPRVLGCGATTSHAFLVLEWMDFGAGSARSEALLGERLAAQHRVTRPRFGWHRDNTIGSTPQLNEWNADWPRFYVERRLRFQLALAERNSHGGRLTERGYRLCETVPAYFSGYRPAPSLLHGDLWCGNWAATNAGEPVIFDPAVYFGDREADLAMTRLFGGFGPDFYAAYQSSWPLDPGAGNRRDLYNLYHVLNHLNLFGGGYRSQALSMIDGLLASASG